MLFVAGREQLIWERGTAHGFLRSALERWFGWWVSAHGIVEPLASWANRSHGAGGAWTHGATR
jgi:hypothetical protein